MQQCYICQIDSLKTRIDGLQMKIKDLNERLAAIPSVPAPSPIPQNDPDGIYQHGAQVGSVSSPQIDES